MTAVMKCNYFINFAEKPKKIQLYFLGFSAQSAQLIKSFAFLTAKIIALLDFISTVKYLIHIICIILFIISIMNVCRTVCFINNYG